MFKIANLTDTNKRIRLIALDSAMSNIDDSTGAVAKDGRNVLLCLAPKDEPNHVSRNIIIGNEDYDSNLAYWQSLELKQTENTRLFHKHPTIPVPYLDPNNHVEETVELKGDGTVATLKLNMRAPTLSIIEEDGINFTALNYHPAGFCLSENDPWEELFVISKLCKPDDVIYRYTVDGDELYSYETLASELAELDESEYIYYRGTFGASAQHGGRLHTHEFFDQRGELFAKYCYIPEFTTNILTPTNPISNDPVTLSGLLGNFTGTAILSSLVTDKTLDNIGEFISDYDEFYITKRPVMIGGSTVELVNGRASVGGDHSGVAGRNVDFTVLSETNDVQITLRETMDAILTVRLVSPTPIVDHVVPTYPGLELFVEEQNVPELNFHVKSISIRLKSSNGVEIT